MGETPKETPKEVKPKEPAEKGRTWAVVLAVFVVVLRHTPLWLWRFFALGILALVYMNVLSRGLVDRFPELGVKISKSWPQLAAYQEWKDLRQVQPLVLLCLVMVFVAWEVVLRCAFGEDKFFQRYGRPEMVKRWAVGVSVVIIAGDAFFYYCGIQEGGWQSSVSVSAIVATVVFVAINAMVVMVSLFLSPKNPQEKENK